MFTILVPVDWMMWRQSQNQWLMYRAIHHIFKSIFLHQFVTDFYQIKNSMHVQVINTFIWSVDMLRRKIFRSNLAHHYFLGVLTCLQKKCENYR